jgi:hypothetical protein
VLCTVTDNDQQKERLSMLQAIIIGGGLLAIATIAMDTLSYRATILKALRGQR